ncbi:MAG TPA: hypothetical protein VFA15_08945, partial [Nitrososphaera sp.]|nr:hypothetical protein [Nitrososphaera sp.]
MHDSLAHTAEHAFIGSLQSILGQNLRVRKVEHRRPKSGTAFIVIPVLDLDSVAQAEKTTNDLIAEGRAVRIRSFESLDA